MTLLLISSTGFSRPLLNWKPIWCKHFISKSHSILFSHSILSLVKLILLRSLSFLWAGHQLLQYLITLVLEKVACLGLHWFSIEVSWDFCAVASVSVCSIFYSDWRGEENLLLALWVETSENMNAEFSFRYIMCAAKALIFLQL